MSNKWLRKAAVWALWLVAWGLLALAVHNDLLLAGPLAVARRLVELVPTTVFWSSLGVSALRVGLGFVAAYVCALLLSWVAARHDWVDELLRPFALACKSVPVVCVAVLLIVWVGSRQAGAVVVFLVVFPAVYFSALTAWREADLRILGALRVLGVPTSHAVLAYVWPHALSYLQANAQSVVGMSWKAGIAAELIGMPLGSVGERIYQAKLLFESADLFAWTIVVMVASAVCERLFVALLDESARWCCRWAAPVTWADPEEQVYEPGVAGFGSVGFSYDDVPVIEGLAHFFPCGSKTCLTDESGAGKTTALLLLAGLLEPDVGEVVRSPPVSACFQDPLLVEWLSARANVGLVARHFRGVAWTESLLAELLEPEAWDRPVRELSGGQRRRVTLARALARPSALLLLDEPFVSLDADARLAAVRCVNDHLEGRTLIVATHEPDVPELLGAQAVKLVP